MVVSLSRGPQSPPTPSPPNKWATIVSVPAGYIVPSLRNNGSKQESGSRGEHTSHPWVVEIVRNPGLI